MELDRPRCLTFTTFFCPHGHSHPGQSILRKTQNSRIACSTKSTTAEHRPCQVLFYGNGNMGDAGGQRRIGCIMVKTPARCALISIPLHIQAAYNHPDRVRRHSRQVTASRVMLSSKSTACNKANHDPPKMNFMRQPCMVGTPGVLKCLGFQQKLYKHRNGHNTPRSLGKYQYTPVPSNVPNTIPT